MAASDKRAAGLGHDPGLTQSPSCRRGISFKACWIQVTSRGFLPGRDRSSTLCFASRDSRRPQAWHSGDRSQRWYRVSCCGRQPACHALWSHLVHLFHKRKKRALYQSIGAVRGPSAAIQSTVRSAMSRVWIASTSTCRTHCWTSGQAEYWLPICIRTCKFGSSFWWQLSVRGFLTCTQTILRVHRGRLAPIELPSYP